ncbi:ribonuclease H-like domain-containing protein [Armillaria borealis]|uniref:Ribonuclease H-like domain-containing protein n=1 Tax=Armillaria borealis TaxID=47425 RepID=A0AA39MGP6_9AGAR|nr:ribonuclease H-like domain-containing protein [Armillaria borealis]
MLNLGPLWKFFHRRSKQNSAQYKAYCIACIKHHRPSNIPVDVDVEPLIDDAFQALWNAENWFKTACETAGSKQGEKGAMSHHILQECLYALKEAKAAAKKARGEHAAATDGDDEGNGSDSNMPRGKKRKLTSAVKRNFMQSELKVFKGINIPFMKEQTEVVKVQFLHATISANLPYRWTSDPEVIKLFLLFRSTADHVIPEQRAIASRLLNTASETVETKLKEKLNSHKKDDHRNLVTGVNVSLYLVDLAEINKDKKDGVSMCAAFKAMIAKVEHIYGCLVCVLVTDNDGGSHNGRDRVGNECPWLFVPPCCAHQFQLTLGDYFKKNPDGALIAGQATKLIGWILNHMKVRVIFDETQAAMNKGVVLTYLVANLTRWMTHYIAFNHLLLLKAPLQSAAYMKRDKIVMAQVGAEKRAREREWMTDMANMQCDHIEDPWFWAGLQTVIKDIEPLCYSTNINQSDKTRPNQVLLTFAGLFLHFAQHADRHLSAGMKKRIEKRWKALDQPMFVFALILNPYERLESFGEGADVNVFTLNTTFIELYKRVQSRPPPEPLSPEALADLEGRKQEKEKQASSAFLQEIFWQTHGDDPNKVWENLHATPEVTELAELALLLLGMVVNQAGNERDFSDLKIKQTRLHNCLAIPKLEKMSKVGANIRSDHIAQGLVESWEKRQNHEIDHVQSLLAVPRYADIIDGPDDELESWRERKKGRLPQGKMSHSLQERLSRQQFDHETLLMELLAAEHSGEEPDDGALEGSGDDFEG